MDSDFLKVQKDIAEKVVAATYKKGLISSVDVQSWTVDVMLIGDYQSVLKNVKLSNTILVPPAIGQYCRIDVFDIHNPADMVVSYTYGKSSAASPGYSGSITYVKTVGPPPTYGTLNFANGIITSYT
jgi:hypothetical protein